MWTFLLVHSRLWSAFLSASPLSGIISGSNFWKSCATVRLGRILGHQPFHRQQNNCYSWLKQAPVNDNRTPTGRQCATLANQCLRRRLYRRMLPRRQSIAYFFNADGQQHRRARPSDLARDFVALDLRWRSIFLFHRPVYATFFSPRNKFRTRHTLETFIKVQAKMWPVIAPIVQFQPDRNQAPARRAAAGARSIAAVRRSLIARGMDRLAPHRRDQRHSGP